jgi:hypothetical protein
MLFAVTASYSAENRNRIAERFLSVIEEGEMPAGVKLICRYHSTATRWAVMVLETDTITGIHLWAAKFNDLVDFDIHPVETEDSVQPIVEAILEGVKNT